MKKLIPYFILLTFNCLLNRFNGYDITTATYWLSSICIWATWIHGYETGVKDSWGCIEERNRRNEKKYDK